MVQIEKKPKYNLYDIYGFTLAVEDTGNRCFEKEYHRFKVEQSSSNYQIDLYVKEAPSNCEILPTRQSGDYRGILLPFGENNNTVLYNRGADSGFILGMVEPLIRWEDKCFLHAGAVSRDDKAVLFPAGPDTGKTSMVLQLLQRGYRYLGDDQLVIGNGLAYPFPKSLHIFDYNLASDKTIAKQTLKYKYPFYNCFKVYFRLKNFLKTRFPSRKVRWLLEYLTSVYYVDVQELLPTVEIGDVSSISHVFFLQLWGEEEVQVVEMDPEELATKMAYMNLIERGPFFNEYFRYAFRGKRDQRVENAFAHDREIMLDTFHKAKTYKILIPEGSKTASTYADIAALVDRYFGGEVS